MRRTTQPATAQPRAADKGGRALKSVNASFACWLAQGRKPPPLATQAAQRKPLEVVFSF